jgi:hypothetical protein
MAAYKMTVKLVDELCDLFRKGITIEGATGIVGIHKSTYFDWRERGNAARALREQGKPVPRHELPYLHFVDKVDLARNYGEGWLQQQLLEAIADPKTRGQWQGYMTMLERTRPDRFRRRAAAEYIAQKPQTPAEFTFDPQKLSNDELDSLQVLLEKARPDQT